MATSKNILESLKTTKFTRGMDLNHLEKLAAMAFEVTLSEGQTVFSEGDLGDVIYIIEEGLVAVETHIPGRGRTTLFTLGPGQVLGWSALFPNKHKTANSRALMATRAVAISTPQLREAFEGDCDFGYAFTWRIAELISDRLKGTRLQLMDIFAPTSGS